jgi:peroxiredoxin
MKTLNFSARLAFCLLLAASLPLKENPEVYSSLSEIPAEKKSLTLLVFFSVACPSCWEDLVELVYFVEKNGLSVQVVGVTSSPEEELEEFMIKYSIGCPVVRDARRALYREHGIDCEPWNVILKDGAVVQKDNPYQDYQSRRKEVERCLLRLSGK